MAQEAELAVAGDGEEAVGLAADAEEAAGLKVGIFMLARVG